MFVTAREVKDRTLKKATCLQFSILVLRKGLLVTIAKDVLNNDFTTFLVPKQLQVSDLKRIRQFLRPAKRKSFILLHIVFQDFCQFFILYR